MSENNENPDAQIAVAFILFLVVLGLILFFATSMTTIQGTSSGAADDELIDQLLQQSYY